ncbi:MAG: hypothetical protein NZ853_04320 [Leptospiraceae bacterium]|nr:hypothetical protein [Leptospiraceae bacterium]MDW7975399.1 hypothetical protein [Leptospiraceae bacterium]
MIKDSELLVLFDFDTLIYNKNNVWRVVHPSLGRVGGAVDVLVVLNFFLQNFEKPRFDLLEYYIPSISDFPVFSVKEIQNTEWNLFPIGKLQEGILQHKIRGRKMYFITLLKNPKIQEILFHKLSHVLEENLFWQIPWKEYWVKPSINQIKSYEFPQFLKLIFIKKLIKRLNRYEKEQLDFEVKYKRIFYYTTDIEILHLLRQYFFEHLEEYEFKHKTVISYLITKT